MSGTWDGSSVMAVRPITPSPFRIRVARRASASTSACLGRHPLDELLGDLVVLEHHAAVQPRQLDGPRDDGGQHRLEIERRADRTADLAEGRELLDGAGQLLRPRLQLGEQPHVLDRDHRLVGEGLNERNLEQ